METQEEIKSKIKIYAKYKWMYAIEKCAESQGNVWKMIKAKKCGNDALRVENLIRNGMEANTTSQKADILAEHCEAVHNITKNMSDETTTNLVNNSVYFIKDSEVEVMFENLTSPNEIVNIIKKLGAMKAPGLDNI